jgi:hypothetical protein
MSVLLLSETRTGNTGAVILLSLFWLYVLGWCCCAAQRLSRRSQEAYVRCCGQNALAVLLRAGLVGSCAGLSRSELRHWRQRSVPAPDNGAVPARGTGQVDWLGAVRRRARQQV